MNNNRISHAHLPEPLLAVARRECQATPGRVQLVAHDWSTLRFANHTRKTDRATLQGSEHLGDDLHLALLVNADDGSPVAPLDLTFRTDATVLTTRPDPIAFAEFPAAHVDPVQASRTAIAALDLPARLVHVIDRETDSVFHWRAWDPKHRLLIRTDDRRVIHDGQSVLLSARHVRLKNRERFHSAGVVRYHGRKAESFVAEVSVT